MRRRVVLVALLAALVLPRAVDGQEATTTVADEAQYRAALTALSADASGPHTIDLAADITVDDGTDPTYTGTQPLTIDGHGFTLDGAFANRLLVVDSPTDAAVTLTTVRMRQGFGVTDGGAVQVLNDSPLAITDSTFEDNSALASGGAVEVATVATVERSDFVRNESGAGDGGALDATAAEGRITVRQSTFDGNRALTGYGGAISAVGFGSPGADTGIHGSTFVGNHAADGGALVVGGGTVVANSTFVANSATGAGGALLGDGNHLSAIVYVTATGNISPQGSNLAARGRELNVLFTALGEPSGGANCASVNAGTFQATESQADDGSCRGADRVDDLGLGPLADNGGRTPTREPVAGSPLIDAIVAGYGFPSIPGGCAEFQQLEPRDQRGVERPQDGDGEVRIDDHGGQQLEVAADCDVGAVEAEAVVAPPIGPVAGGPAFTG